MKITEDHISKCYNYYLLLVDIKEAIPFPIFRLLYLETSLKLRKVDKFYCLMSGDLLPYDSTYDGIKLSKRGFICNGGYVCLFRHCQVFDIIKSTKYKTSLINF